MECFGVNLQRKNHYDRLHEQISAMNALTKSKSSETDKQIRDHAEIAGDAMRSILSTSVADSVLLKNKHNELFLRLMESIERDKNMSTQYTRKMDIKYDDDDEPIKFDSTMSRTKLEQGTLPAISKSKEDLFSPKNSSNSPTKHIVLDVNKTRNGINQNSFQTHNTKTNTHSPNILQQLQHRRKVDNPFQEKKKA